MKIVIGIDFGSDSVRVLAVDAQNGTELAEGSCCYPRWKEKRFCDADRQIFRHHPADYLEAMTAAVLSAMSGLTKEQRAHVRGIGVDATGSTVCPIDDQGIPLAMLPGFVNDPDAMFHLWKDHSATEEAKEINIVFAQKGKYNYLRYQGAYSAEWYWAKMLHTIRLNSEVRDASVTWVELADWIPAWLTGRTNPREMYRCACAAGHKTLWNSHFNGLPDEACLNLLDPYLSKAASYYPQTPGFSTDRVGVLTEEWRAKLGLPQGVIISGSSLDAHAGAVGAGVCPGTLVKVIGTSTVDMTVSTEAAIEGKPIEGVCGIAENSILPGYVGLEAGQAAFGDIFAWFQSLLSWSADHSEIITDEQRQTMAAHLLLKLEAALPDDDVPCELVILDWFNGRRYPNNNDSIRAAAMGLSLGSDVPKIYRSLVMGAVMGSKAIFNAIVNAGVEVEQVIAVGGITHKSRYVMQLMADALNRSVKVSKSLQTCALGAAMYAAVASGCCASLQEAQQTMGSGILMEYTPDTARQAGLQEYYRKYTLLTRMTNQWYH
ncbi:MAG: ribulokinase [Eubacteriales bacterium]|nr:ribulokinase [Eubacteriales bacterium]